MLIKYNLIFRLPEKVTYPLHFHKMAKLPWASLDPSASPHHSTPMYKITINKKESFAIYHKCKKGLDD